MQRQQYCVYNETGECCLSLGVTIGDGCFERIRELLGFGTRRVHEGSWLVRSKGLHTIGFFSSCDLIYLDDTHKVVHLVEALPPFRIAPLRRDSQSLLVLPVNTIYHSQTQHGNQLVICAAHEMEFQLRSTPSFQKR